jgi:hypothetical protein
MAVVCMGVCNDEAYYRFSMCSKPLQHPLCLPQCTNSHRTCRNRKLLELVLPPLSLSMLDFNLSSKLVKEIEQKHIQDSRVRACVCVCVGGGED